MKRGLQKIFHFLILLPLILSGSVFAAGELDTTFTPGTGANGAIYAQATQSDGKIIIAGAFTTYNGTTRNRIARINLNGTLDTTFNPGTGADGAINSIEIQSDGKIIIGGAFTTYNGTARSRIARVLSTGAIDTTFAPGTGANNTIQVVRLQSDGNILIGGNFTTYNGTARARVARVLTTGLIDTSFDPGAGASGTVYDIALQSTGDIIIGGDFATYDGVLRNRIVKVSSIGDIDLAYNTVTGANDIIYDRVLQSDGKVILVGAFTTFNGVTRNRVARLNTDLSLDTSFNPGTGPDNIVRAVGLQSTGKVIIGGDFLNVNGTSRYRIARLNTDGTFDSTFGSLGTSGYGFNGVVNDLDIQTDDKVVAGGTFTTTDGAGVVRIARLLSTGTVDSTFNWGLGGPNNTVRTVNIESSGNIVIGGDFTTVNGVERNRIARLTTTGANSGNFGWNGAINNYPYARIALSDGKMIVGGVFTTVSAVSETYIARLNIDNTNDATFNNGGAGPNNYVMAMAQQSDGKIVIGGYFTTYNGTARNRIARINADGTLDTTFNPGSGANSYVYSVTVQSDGKILIGGYFTTYNGITKNYVARLNANGSLDETFNPGTAANGTVKARAIQSDGKIVIGGSFTNVNGRAENYISRLNTDGTFDTAFNPGTGPNGAVEYIEIQTDGKIVLGGSFTTINGTASAYIGRLNTNGSLDSTFTVGTGFNNAVYALKLQSDGKILAGGSFTSYAGTARTRIIRINSNGTIDTTFNPGTGANNTVRTIDVQSDGKIIIGGDFTVYNGVDKFRIARLFTGGGLDQSFNTGTYANSSVYARVVQPDGKVIIGGSFSTINGQTEYYLSRLNTDGSIDTGFNAGGAGPNSYIYAIALQADGKILIGGYMTTYNGSTANYVARLNTNGSLDTSFSSGTGLYAGGAYTPYVYALAVQSDGKILIGGAFTSYNGVSRTHIVRVNSNGSVDMTYNPATSANGTVWKTHTQSDGKIIIVGAFTIINGVTQNRIARYNTDGTLDTSFSIGTGANNTIMNIVAQSDGKFMITGSFTTYNGTGRNRVARLNANGTLDTTFNPGTGFNSNAEPIAIQSDGKIVIGGSFTTFNGVSKTYLARLNSNGTLDTTFPASGTLTNSTVMTLAIQPADQKIIVGGNFTTYNGVAVNRLVRLNTNGTNDTTFTIGTGVNNYIENLYLQSDGKIVLVGAFTTYNGVSRPYIARVNSNGSLDTTFTPGTGGNAAIKVAEIQSDGKILIGGTFTTYNGTARTRVARLLSNGTLDTTYSVTTGPDNTVEVVTKLPSGNIFLGGDFGNISSVSRTRVGLVNSAGTLVGIFNPGVGANSYVYGIGIQTDNKIVLGGYFTQYNNQGRNYITRTNTDGSLDGSFNPGTGCNNYIYNLRLQSDNKPIIVGGFTTYNGTSRNYLARINTNGSLDTTFNPGTGANNVVYDLDIQTDGKVIFGGAFTTINATARGRIARLNSNGTLDTTYASGAGANSNVLSIALYTDGTAFIGGDFTSLNGATRTRLAKINTLGNTHADFDQGNGTNGIVRKVLIQPTDQKVLIGGDFTNYNNVTRNRLIRVNTDGSYDGTFAVGTSMNGSIYDIDLQTDGKVVVGGGFTTYNGTAINRVARINTNGTLDSAFTPGTGANNTVQAMVVEGDGKIIIGGDFLTYNGKARTRLARLNTTGTINGAFDPGSGANSYVYTISEQTDGKIILGGYFTQYNFASNGTTMINGTSGVAKNYLLRVNSDGRYDSTFNTGTGPNNYVYVSKLQSDGKVILGGDFTTYNAISSNRFARIGTNGTIDSSFTLGTGANNTVFDLDIDAGGKILLGGTFTTINGTARNRLARVNTNGALDTTFAPTSGANSNVRVIAQRADGKVYIGGDFGTVDGLTRTRSALVNDNGTVNLDVGLDNSVYSVLVQPNGRIVAGGTFTQANSIPRTRLTRFLSNGSLDTTFNPGSGPNSTVLTVDIQSDNKLLIGGSFTNYNGTASSRIARLSTLGAYDATFGIGSGANSTIRTIGVESAGTIIAGGDFGTFNGYGRNKIVRLNSNGTVTSDLEPPSGFDAVVRTLYVDSTDKVLAGGDFTTYNGTARQGLARLNTTGTLNSFNIQTNAGGSVYSIQKHPLDNKLLIGGNFTTLGGLANVNIARVTTSDTVDNTFIPGGGANNIVYSAIESASKVLIGGNFTTYDGTAINRIARLIYSYSVPSTTCILPWNRAWTATDDCSLAQSAKVFGNITVGDKVITLPNGRVLGIDLSTRKITFTTGRILMSGTAKIDNSITNGFLYNISFSNGAITACPTGMHVLTSTTPQSAFISSFTSSATSGTMYCALP